MVSYICKNCSAIVVSEIPVHGKECPVCKKSKWTELIEVEYNPSFYCQSNLFHPTISC